MTITEIETIAAISAAIAFITALWSRISQVGHWLFSQVVVEQRCSYAMGSIVLAYLNATGKQSKRGTKTV